MKKKEFADRIGLPPKTRMIRRLLSLALLSLAFAGQRTAEAKVPAELERLSRDYLKSGAKSSRDELLSYASGQSSAQTKALAEFGLGMGDYEAKNYTAAAGHPERRRIHTDSMSAALCASNHPIVTWKHGTLGEGLVSCKQAVQLPYIVRPDYHSS